jgi:heat shock protein HslJ
MKTQICCFFFFFLILGCGQSPKTNSGNGVADSLIKSVTSGNVVSPESPVNSDTLAGGKDTVNKVEGIWVLEAMNDTLLNTADYPSGSPYLEFNIKGKKISGFVGCNGIGGTYEATLNMILFSKLSLQTNNNCPAKKTEKEVMKNLSAQKIPYEFAGGKLLLKGGTSYTFRRLQ